MKIKMCLMAVFLSIITGCGMAFEVTEVTDVDVHRAMDTALSPECTADATRDIFSQVSRNAPASVTTAILGRVIGTNNFTHFFFGLKEDSPLVRSGDYEFTLPAVVDQEKLALQMSTHLSVVAPGDIRDLSWTMAPDGRLSGSFSVSTAYDLRATFLFEAVQKDKKIRINRLAVKKKGSDTIADGFPIFTTK